MRRAFAYFAAFTGMGAIWGATLLTAALVLGAPAQTRGEGTSTPQAASGPLGTIEIHAFDLGFKPTATTVAAPGRYTLKLVNDGGILHDVTLDDGTKVVADAHQTATGEVAIPAGGIGFHCSVPGHADAGMKGRITVAPGASGSVGPSAKPISAQQMADQDAARTKLFPAKTTGKGGQLLKPSLLGDGTKVFDLTARVIQWETEPGKTVTAWAYNGMVPGPTIRAKLGDRVRIVIHNALPAPTTIHFHGMTVPNDQDGVATLTQKPVMPGQTYTYAFTVRNVGSNMYHSHFMADQQVPMGLLGAFIVDDPTAPRVDLDYTMILNDGPLGFTLNGKSFPATEPIVVKRGQKVLVRYMNEGLQIHPMHLHGMPQQVIALDGHRLPQPFVEDTVLVAPGQRVDVLIDATEVGTWAFHCHILTHAESADGMFGMVTALVVAP